MYGVVLVAVLLVMGGAIAFIGDRLGTRVGKKRLSIFGLRPRHTSILVTIVTGICITGATFGIMSAVSENVRTALFGMEKLNARMANTEKSLAERTQDLAEATEQKALADKDLKKSQEDVQKLRDEQESLRAESAQLKEGNTRLSSENAQLSAENGSLAGENKQLTSENSSLETRNDQLSGENQSLGQKNEQLTTDNKALETRAKQLADGLVNMREGNIVYRAGEVIASGIVRGNRPIPEVRRDMEALANLAGRDVSQRMGKNVAEDSLWLYQPEFESAIGTIAKSPKDMVVRIVAAGNLLHGEPVRTSIALYPNSIIYRDNELILARPVTIQNGAEAEGIVMQFLRDINGAATGRGMLPDPIRGTVGIMDGAQFFAFVNKLANERGNMVLSAYAKGATDALGPLRLDLRMEHAHQGGY